MEFVSLEEAAKALNINQVRLLQYIDSGKLKTTAIEGQNYVSKSELERFSKELSIGNSSQESRGLALTPPNRSLFSRRTPIRHSQIFPGVSSTIMEAIVEMSRNIQLLSELKEVVNEHAEDCVELLESIESQGITDPHIAIDLLLLDEAIRNLSIRRSLFVRLLEGTAMVLLPLPPHLSDMVLGVARHDHIFNTDKNLPPHLKHSHYTNLDFVPIFELERLTDGVDTVVLEGYIEHRSFYIRDTASNLIYLLSNKGLKDIFVHSIPHIPPHSRFIELVTKDSDITVTVL